MGVYEEYAGYRQAWINRDEYGRGISAMEGFVELTPQRAVEMWTEKAVQDAKEQLRSFNVPEGEDIQTRFPGIDPQGKACEVDMSFAQREQRLRTALQVRSPALQNAAQKLLTHTDMVQAMKGECEQIRVLDRAAKLCYNPEGTERLLQEKERMLSGKGIRTYEAMLTGLEQLAGLRPGELSDETQYAFSRGAQPITNQTAAKYRAPGVMPPNLNINFQNFEGCVRQGYLSNPENWGKDLSSMPKDMADSPAAQRVVGAYARATVNNSLDTFYGPAEAAGPTRAAMEVNRGDLITVDGKTIKEILQEQFEKTHPGQEYTQEQYQAEYHQRSADLVATGLMTGKRVEAFIPDGNGRMPKEPVQITKNGYQPSPLTPVILNGFERFCNKMGMFKEKAAKADLYARVMASRQRVHESQAVVQERIHDAAVEEKLAEQAVQAERAQKQEQRQEQALPQKQEYFKGLYRDTKEMDPGAPIVRNAFYGSYEKTHPPVKTTPVQDPSFRLDRTAPITTCIGLLATQGHDIKDIMDPAKLGTERDAALALYMEKVHQGDRGWMADTLMKGQEAMQGQFDKVMKGLNLSNWDEVMKETPTLGCIGQTLLDIRQEMQQFKPEIAQRAAEAPKRWRQMRNDPGAEQPPFAESFGVNMTQALYARQPAQTILDEKGTSVMAQSAIMEAYYRQALPRQQNSYIAMPPSLLMMPGEANDLMKNIPELPGATDLMATLKTGDPDKLEAFHQRVLTEEFQKSLHLTKTMTVLPDRKLLTSFQMEIAGGKTLTEIAQPSEEKKLHQAVQEMKRMENGGSAMRKLFFEENMAKHDGKLTFSRQFHVADRSSGVGACIGYLASQGHHIKDIMDPTKLQAERAAIGKLYEEKEAQGDEEWLGKVQYDGHKAIMGQLEGYAAQIDFGNEQQMTKHMPQLSALTMAAFDISQDINRPKAHTGVAYYRAAMKDMPGADNKTLLAQDTKLNNIITYVGAVKAGLESKDTLNNFQPTDKKLTLGASLVNMMAGKEALKLMQDSLAKNPQMSLGDRVTFHDLAMLTTSIEESPLCRTVQNLVAMRGPHYCAKLGKELGSGKFLDKCVIQRELVPVGAEEELKLNLNQNGELIGVEKAYNEKPGQAVFLHIDAPGLTKGKLVAEPQLPDVQVQAPQVQALPVQQAPKAQAPQAQAPKVEAPKIQPPQMGGRSM